MKKFEKKDIEDRKVRDHLRKIVIARLNAIPKDIEISVGSRQYTKEQLLQFVKQHNEIGNQLMEMQLEYLRDLASGKIYDLLDEQNNLNYSPQS